MKCYRLTVLLPLILLLSCDDSLSISQICEKNPLICSEFNDDSWCKNQRIDLIHSNITLASKPSDENKFKTLMAYQIFEKCITNASGVEPIKLKEKKTKRIEDMLKARDKIKQLSDETIDSKYPRLLYYHWSHNLNKQSLAQFLELEGDPVMETSGSQYELATYYAKRDINKTRQLLLHALELYQGDDNVNLEIFKSLTSIYQKLGDQKQAYIWLKVLSLSLPNNGQAEISDNSLDIFAHNTELDLPFLDKVAKATLASIHKGEFISPMKTAKSTP